MVIFCVILLLVLAGLGFIAFKLRQRVLTLQELLTGLVREKKTIYQFLDEVGQKITQGTDMEKTMEIIVDFSQEITKADAACLFVRRHGTRQFAARVVRGMFPPLHKTQTERIFAKRKFVAEMVKKAVVEEGEGIIGLAAKEGKSYLIPDATQDTRLSLIQESGVPIMDLIVVPLKVRNEVLGVIALVNKRDDGPFNESDLALLTAMADQAAVTIDLVRLNKLRAEQQRIEHELELAHMFQSILLPRKTPEFPRVRLASFYRSALEVGGDYFDFIPLDEERLGIAVGDVSGKGIPGAIVMATIRASLRAEARQSDSPKEVLRRVNEQAFQDTQQNIFITMTYGILDTTTGLFRFCRAGHEPVLCCKNEVEEVSTYTPEGIALGIISGELFNVTEEQEIDLSRENLAILYTDGVVEAMNHESEEYGERRFHNVVRRASSQSPAEVIEEIVKDIEKFTEGIPQHDDITLVALGWNKNVKIVDDAADEMKCNTA